MAIGEPFLGVAHIHKSFSGVKALQDVSMDIAKGEILCLIGENGSGKSTLVKIIAGVLRPDSGEISIDGRKHSALSPIEAVRAGIQIIYQDFSLFTNLTVAENIAFNYLLAQGGGLVSKRQIYETAQRALDLIQTEIPLDAVVEEVPVAGKQLIAISRSLLQNARLIVMDEPTTALTRHEVDNLFVLINRLKASNVSFLFVSHKLAEVQEISDRIVVLRNGQKIVEDAASSFDAEKMTFFMTGSHIEMKSFDYEKTGAASLLEVRDLSLENAFSHVSFSLGVGEIIGITGLLGSGRTELALSLFGVRPANGGQITIEGEAGRISTIQDAIRKGIGYVPEDRTIEGLFLAKPIYTNLVVRLIDSGRRLLLDVKKLRTEAESWSRALSIKHGGIDLPVSSLSGGNQQRVVLAKWFAGNTKILILNGPTVGVDVGSKAELHELIRKAAHEGTGVIVLSDDIPELLQLCNRILLMRQGRLEKEFTSTSINEAVLTSELESEVAHA